MGLNIEWKIGCSGFHYKQWKEFFYPPKLPQRLWFQYYSRHFNTLELNSSFYQFPKLPLLKKWYEDSPADFSFSLKVPRLVTHYKKFSDTLQLMEDFYGIIKEGLDNKIGMVLFQLPPQLHYSEEKLHSIINNTNTQFHNAIEFRHASWWNSEVYRQLTAKQICFCGISHPSTLPNDAVINTDYVYYRFHGVPELYKSLYSIDFIRGVADSLLKRLDVKYAYCYFNNTMRDSALINAEWLQRYVGGVRNTEWGRGSLSTQLVSKPQVG